MTENTFTNTLDAVCNAFILPAEKTPSFSYGDKSAR